MGPVRPKDPLPASEAVSREVSEGLVTAIVKVELGLIRGVLESPGANLGCVRGSNCSRRNRRGRRRR